MWKLFSLNVYFEKYNKILFEKVIILFLIAVHISSVVLILSKMYQFTFLSKNMSQY